MSKSFVLLPLAGLVLTLQICVAQWAEIQSLRREFRIMEESRSFTEEKNRGLCLMVSTLTAERESVATRNFILGVVKSMKNSERYEEVWQGGYEQGLKAQSEVID
jgi:hypothetical protein